MLFNVFDLGNRIKKTHFLLKMNIYLLRVTTLLLCVNSLALFAQQTDIDSLTVQTTNLEEVVISDSRFQLLLLNQVLILSMLMKFLNSKDWV